MLLDWPEEKKELHGELARALRRYADAAAPMAAHVPHVYVEEGAALRFVYPDGTQSEMKLESHEVAFTVNRDEFVSGDASLLAQVVREISGSMAKQLESMVMETVNTSPGNGTVMFRGTDAEDMGEQLLRAVDHLEFDFDDNGTPQLTMFAAPDVFPRLQMLNHELGLKQRFEAIIERKHREWLRRESHRRLVN